MNLNQKLFLAKMEMAKKASMSPRAKEALRVGLASLIPILPASSASNLKRIPQTQVGQWGGTLAGIALSYMLAKKKGDYKELKRNLDEMSLKRVAQVYRDQEGGVPSKLLAVGKHVGVSTKESFVNKRMLPYFALIASMGALGAAGANYIGKR